MKPSIGRIVHYTSYGTPGGEYESRCRAAVVTDVHPDCFRRDDGRPAGCVSLAVLNPTGAFFGEHNAYADETEKRGGTWHWPERVEEEQA